MNDQQRMIAEMTGQLFAELGPDATVEANWDAIEAVALPSLLVSEDRGGFGGGWEDAQMVFRLAGNHGVPLPIAEATIAAGLVSDGAPAGRGTIAPAAKGASMGNRFSGVVSAAPWGEGASYVVAPSPDGGAMLIALDGVASTGASNIAGEPRTNWVFDDVVTTPIDADVFALGALARVAQIAGALDAALALAVTHTNQRQQFGRALAKFQAVQQSLATFACEAAAANCAAIGAAQARARGPALYEIAAAKLRANRAVSVGTAVAHQVHGAIGFTQDYPLHLLTRRLWAWRSEFGGDSHWARVLGDIVVGAGADAFWPGLTALSD